MAIHVKNKKIAKSGPIYYFSISKLISEGVLSYKKKYDLDIKESNPKEIMEGS